MCMENDVMPRETLSMVIWEIFLDVFDFLLLGFVNLLFSDI